MNITIPTNKSKEIIDITDTVEKNCGSHTGAVSVFVLHTTAALTLADLDPGTDEDMLEAWYKMLPNIKYRHPHNPSHAPDHILAALIGPDIIIPTSDGKLELGQWQRVVLVELDGPRERKLSINLN